MITTFSSVQLIDYSFTIAFAVLVIVMSHMALCISPMNHINNSSDTGHSWYPQVSLMFQMHSLNFSWDFGGYREFENYFGNSSLETFLQRSDYCDCSPDLCFIRSFECRFLLPSRYVSDLRAGICVFYPQPLVHQCDYLAR